MTKKQFRRISGGRSSKSKKPPSIYYQSEQKRFFSGELRNNPTTQEQLLWDKIKSNQLGVTFTRQKVIAGYIVDFYCQRYKLAIELDGRYHQGYANREYDQNRDKILNSVGVYVLRFWNSKVDNDIDGVIEKIKDKIADSEKREQDKKDVRLRVKQRITLKKEK
jgi:very-short-patch-repair endonuclease